MSCCEILFLQTAPRQDAFSTCSYLGKVFTTYLASLFTPKGGGAKWALLKKDISEDLFLLANLTHLYDALHLHSQVLKASLLTFPFISSNLHDGHLML